MDGPSSYPPPPHPPLEEHERVPVAGVEAESINPTEPLQEDARRADAAAEAILPETTQPHIPHNLENAVAGASSLFPATPDESSILRLSRIILTGNPSIRPSFFANLARPYIDPEGCSSSRLYRLLHSSSGRLDHPPPGSPTTYLDLQRLSLQLGQDLRRMGICHTVQVQLQPSPAFTHGPQSANQDVDVLLQLTQSKGRKLSVQTLAGNGEGSISIKGAQQNLFGGGETIEGTFERGQKTKSFMNIDFQTPLFASPDHSFSLSAYSTERDRTSYASAVEYVKGLRASLGAYDWSSTCNHSLSWEVEHRNLASFSPRASLSMHKMGGQHVKSSLNHTLIRDTRDDLMEATRGSLLKSILEVAPSFLGGDTNFIKWHGQFSTSRLIRDPRLEGFSWSAGAKAGLLHAFSRDPKNRHTVPFSDRFQLGGIESMRMFAENGLGRKDGRDSLGGEAFYVVSAALRGPIPYRREWSLRWQAFVNAGQLGDASLATLTRPSSSAGVGLTYTIGSIRAELNLGMPLTARSTDSMRRGTQFGLGMSFAS